MQAGPIRATAWRERSANRPALPEAGGLPELSEDRRSQIRADILTAARNRPQGRLARLLRNPIRMLLPVAMRRLKLRRDVLLPVPGGGKIAGLLPEAVSTVIWRQGYYEVDNSLSLLHFLKSGTSFLDIGAHFGYFSLFASRLVGPNGRVVAIEAMPGTFSRLQSNLAKHAPYRNALAVRAAAYDCEAELSFRDYGIVASSLNSAFGIRGQTTIASGPGVEVRVRARPADDIVAAAGLQRLDLIKIDAEGSEAFVIGGLRQTIARFRPALLIEVGDATDAGPSAQLIGSVAELGYRPMRWTSSGTLAPYAAKARVDYGNVVFIPI